MTKLFLALAMAAAPAPAAAPVAPKPAVAPSPVAPRPAAAPGTARANSQAAASLWKTAPIASVKSAAESGDAKAMVELAARCEQGKGVPKDPDEALAWLRRAAATGDADAQVAAGTRLAYGPGPESDKAEALKLFAAAAAVGHPQAMYEVGLSHKLGRGTAKNAKSAIEPLTRAAEAGVAAAQCELGDCHETGAGTGAANAERAAYFYRRAADQNHALAQLRLGRMTLKGQGVAANAREGLQLLLRAAQSGLIEAQWEVSQRLANGGDGLAPDKPKAVIWLGRLSDQKHEPAQQQLAALAPDALKKAAKKLAIVGDWPDEQQVGALVLAEGRMINPQGGKGKLAVTSRGREISFAVENLPASKARDGSQVRLYATLADKRTLKGLLVELEPPAFEWKYQLRDPGSLKAGDSKKFFVDGAVKNTGRQVLRNVKVKCRLYQQNSPNDATGELTFEEIKPGQVQPFTVSVDFFNYQYLGATSVPKVEMKVTDYEL